VSVTLVGGGYSSEPDPTLYAVFLADATAAAARRAPDGVLARPRIAIITVREADDLHSHAEALTAALSSAGEFIPAVTALQEGVTATPAALDDVDGILVGGGLTPAYLESITPIAAEIRKRVESGTPYLGFSAGAMIASEAAMIGGWRIGGVEVSAEAAAEELDEVTIARGLGVVDVTVDVHAVQWGNLSRLIATVDAGLVDGGIAIDERTALIVETGALRSVGSGSVWLVTKADDGVSVRTVA
jgi:cyanophycinase